MLYGSCSVRYKFDDERVTKEDIKKALEEQFGGEEEVIFFRSHLSVFQHFHGLVLI